MNAWVAEPPPTELATQDQAQEQADAKCREHCVHGLLADKFLTLLAQVGVTVTGFGEGLVSILAELPGMLLGGILELLCSRLGGGTQVLSLGGSGGTQFLCRLHGAGFGGLKRVGPGG